MVLELPVEYSISSAENFARGAVKIFNSLKVVTDISFGAECKDLATLNNITNVLYTEPNDYRTILSHELKRGLSFPAARENAVMMYLNDIKRYANVLSSANNILAVEYLKALRTQKSKINPVLVERKKVYYDDDRIVDDFASAMAIRKLFSNKEYREVQKVVPKSTYKILGDEFKTGDVVLTLETYSHEIMYTLRRLSIEEIANLPDVSEGLENAIKKAANESNSVEELINAIKSKRYTQTRIQRILLYALLGIDKKMMENSKKIVPYARILAFNGKGRNLISDIIKANPKINMITSVNKFIQEKSRKKSYETLLEMLNIDILATDIYSLGCNTQISAKQDFTHNMVIIK